MRVATWNVNNVRKWLDQLLHWLAGTKPDVVALQELKAATGDFPTCALSEAGYSSLVVGQRSWNGVALLARGHEPISVLASLPGDPRDKEARYVEAAINGVLFCCLYAPNGNPQPGPKFDYKLAWMARLRERTEALWSSGQPVVLLGDWKVVPADQDIYKPDTWRDNALLQPKVRDVFADILAQGWTDALKTVHPRATPFTFWDYRRKRWERDAGLRIDHILVSAALRVADAGVDREERGKEKASDHAPVWAEVVLQAPARIKTRKRLGIADKSNEAGEAPLSRYNAKRDLGKTAEPAGVVSRARRGAKTAAALGSVIQKHWASRLHYDFRLELDGVMLSWTVPKGPLFDPAIKQMAIHVEDHPISYNEFEGTIPKDEYGGGTVIVCDRGHWAPVADPQDGMKKGKLIFKLHGQTLAGLWELVRISKPGEKKQDQWLLFKKRGDAWARPSSAYDVIKALPDSVTEHLLGLVEEREPRAVSRSEGLPGAVADSDKRLATEAPLPLKLAPQLATLASSIPVGDWMVETKYDGYGLLTRIDKGSVKLFTRNGDDWTSKLKPIAAAIEAMEWNGSKIVQTVNFR